MSLYGVMRTGVSGMAAQANKLSAVSDNISNVNTAGYKRASAEFSSLILKSGGGSYNSGSVETHIRYAITDPGNYASSASSTDIAVQGNGFFMVSDPNGTRQFLTRAGQFRPDNQGNLVNLQGFYLMGYPGAVTNVSSNSTAGMQFVNVNLARLQAEPSTQATVNGNLDPSAEVIAGPPGPASYSSKSSVVAYDNIGRPVTLDVYMSKTATAAGVDTWQIQVYDSAAGTPMPGGLGTFTFDTTAAGKGAMVGPPTSLTVDIPGGSAFTIDMASVTQVASSFSFKTTVNGNAPSSVQGVTIDEKGIVTAIFENGTTQPIYTIPLADVPSPDNLKPEVGNVYSVNRDSGNLQIGSAGTGGLGNVASNAVELSNVDLADELTSMIESQRGFTANSKTFQTAADLLDVVVNLKR
jgi:flagellar hook protein FlgE